MTIVLEAKGIRKDRAFIIEFCRLIKEKAHFVNEFYDLGPFFFVAPTSYDEKVIAKKWNESSKELFTKLAAKFEALPEWNTHTLHDSFQEAQTEIGKLDMQLLRVLTTGAAGGPQLFDLLALLGKEETISRLNSALSKL